MRVMCVIQALQESEMGVARDARDAHDSSSTRKCNGSCM
jgi:hypothetical protein